MISITIDRNSLRNVKRNIEIKRKKLTGKRLKKKALKKGAEVVKARAKTLVSVDTGDLRNSIKVMDQGEAVFIVSDDLGAVSSEYLDTPFLRPAAKSEKRAVVVMVAEEYKRNV